MNLWSETDSTPTIEKFDSGLQSAQMFRLDTIEPWKCKQKVISTEDLWVILPLEAQFMSNSFED